MIQKWFTVVSKDLIKHLIQILEKLMEKPILYSTAIYSRNEVCRIPAKSK